MPLPSSVQSIALSFKKWDPLTEPTPTQLSHTQSITLENMQVGTNNAAKSVKIDSTFVSAFNNEPRGTIFTPSIVVNYGNDLTISTSPNFGVPNFVPRKITPTFSLASTLDKLTTDSPFSLSAIITNNNSPGVLSYSSSNTNVAEVDSYGQVTLNGEGTTTISVTQAASNDGRYIAAAISTQVVVSVPPIPRLSLATNDVTIQYTPDVGYVPPSFPLFIQANPRGRVTGPEWFAVVDDTYTSRSHIRNYALTNGTSSSYFTSDDSGLIPFNNIVTTPMTEMGSMFASAYVFDQSIASWDTSNVTNIGFMFHNAYAFNQDISSWDTSNVVNMTGVFNNASAFNQPLNSWDTSNVVVMDYMFYGASAFNQNISSWQVYGLFSKPDKPSLFDTNSALLATHNYPSYLPNWAMSAPVV